ncbi:hypothetical protein BDC45DRAFT_554343 [Circinella umbellata]|nr:hypothetical protein BDC45DRAFT_554343 [Circinella umbellata]
MMYQMLLQLNSKFQKNTNFVKEMDERLERIEKLVHSPCNIGPELDQDTGMYNMLRIEARLHRPTLLWARDQTPSKLKKSWNNYDEGDKLKEITLFEYKVYRMFRLPMHLCKDHWIANFLLKRRLPYTAPSGTRSLVTRTTSMDTMSLMSGISGQAASSPGPSLSIRSVASEMSTDSVAQNTSGER